jgi:hypothetical protein
MKKRRIVLTGILVVYTILSLSGCDIIKEEFATGSVMPVPAECDREANYLDRALYGSRELGQVSQLQVTRVTNELNTCLLNAGFSEADAKATVKDRIQTFDERPDKGKVEGDKDIFIF